MCIFKTPAPEVDKPTYDIVDTVERFDQRDETNIRVLLEPGSPEYDAYYAWKPQNKDIDDELRRIRKRAYEKNWARNPINEQFLPATFYSMAVLGQPSVVDGSVGSHMRPGGLEKVPKVDPLEMAHKLKGFGMYLGASKVRITKLKQEWVCSHYGDIFPGYSGQPTDDMNLENIVCMAVPHNQAMKNIGRGMEQETEDGWIYTYASLISIIVAHYIRCLGFKARPLPSSNSPYLAVPVFVDAGIGEQGRHAFCVSKDIGCNWRPGAVATDMPLAVDKPVDFGLQDFCLKCKLCAEICPSKAISFGGKEVHRGVRRWAFDGNACAKYWQQMGNSCGMCQAVCPWNHKDNLLHNGIRELIQRFSFLRSAIIKGEKLWYGEFKRVAPPDWMTTPGYIED